MLGATGALQLTGYFKLVKHNIREQVRSQQTTICGHALSHKQEAGLCQHRLLSVRTGTLAAAHTSGGGGLWTAVRVHQRGMITSQCCPYCKRADETEQHILWECAEWVAARDLHIANVRALAAKVLDLPPYDRWPPCLKISGLLPEIEAPVNREVEQHDLRFIQALHAMFVAILAARKLRDQQAPKLFPTVRLQARSAYPYHQLVGPMPPPPPTNFAGDFYPVMGGGKAAQAPYTVTRRRAPQPTAPATCDLAPSPMISSHACLAHKLPACVTCKRLC